MKHFWRLFWGILGPEGGHLDHKKKLRNTHQKSTLAPTTNCRNLWCCVAPPCIPIPRAQKPPKPRNTQKLYKTPHPGSSPPRTQEKNEKYKICHFWATFVFLSVSFSDFGGPTLGGGSCILSFFFFVFVIWGNLRFRSFELFTRPAGS